MTPKEKYVLDSVGLVVHRGALGAKQVQRLKRATEGARVSQAGKFSLLDRGPEFMDLIEHDWVMEMCRGLLGDRFRFDHAFGLEQPPARPNLHGGPLSCQGSCFYHGSAATDGRPNVGRLSVGFALTPQSRASGGFAYLPGSHNSAFARHGGVVVKELFDGTVEDDSVVVPELEPGDAVLFPDCLVHGTSPWQAAHTRRVLYYMYSPGYMAWRPYAEIERYAELARTDRQRRLLRPPYVASFEEVDGMVGENRWREPTL